MTFEPVNDFERSLIKAANDPAHRPQFYRDLLAAELFAILAAPSTAPEGQRFATKPQVRRAYLALMSAGGDQSHTLIALEADGNWDDILGGAGLVMAQNVEIPNPPVDFLQMTGQTPMETHLREKVKPFYERK